MVKKKSKRRVRSRNRKKKSFQEYTKRLNKSVGRRRRGYLRSLSDKSIGKLCDKYKDKEVRGTPKNWAYNRCRKKKNKTCETLPPQGWNMYRYFCE